MALTRLFDISRIVFAFFCIGFFGWVMESVQETIVRKKFVNKGFFKGPFLPVHGFGGIIIYAAVNPMRSSPLLVFLASFIGCTIIEYITAIFLEKCFKVKCWDYRTYPHTKWCHFQGRICFTISLFFGFWGLFVVYVFWKFIIDISFRLGSILFIIDSIFIAAFIIDVIFSCAKIIKTKNKGGKIKGFAVFSFD